MSYVWHIGDPITRWFCITMVVPIRDTLDYVTGTTFTGKGWSFIPTCWAFCGIEKVMYQQRKSYSHDDQIFKYNYYYFRTYCFFPRRCIFCCQYMHSLPTSSYHERIHNDWNLLHCCLELNNKFFLSQMILDYIYFTSWCWATKSTGLPNLFQT